MSLVELLTITLTIVSKFLDKLPTYEQSKKDKFYELKTKYETEMAKDYTNRDDNALDNMRDQLQQLLADFSSEVSGQKIQAMPGLRNA